jgi:hypothetical protein
VFDLNQFSGQYTDYRRFLGSAHFIQIFSINTRRRLLACRRLHGVDCCTSEERKRGRLSSISDLAGGWGGWELQNG